MNKDIFENIFFLDRGAWIPEAPASSIPHSNCTKKHTKGIFEGFLKNEQCLFQIVNKENAHERD